MPDRHSMLEKSKKILHQMGMNQALFTFLLFFFGSLLFIDQFALSTNLINVFRQGALIFSFSIGMTITMLLSGLDLSIGAVGSLSSVVAATLITSGNMFLGVLVGLIVGALLGLSSGIAIARFNVPSFIMTFGMMKIANGLSLEFTQGQAIYGFDNSFRFIGIGYVGPIPMPLLINFIVLLILVFVLKNTVFGRSVYAVGSNKNAAKFSGISYEFTIMVGYMLSGLFSAFAGLLLIARLGSAESIMGEEWSSQAIAASVLGGVSFAGGKGSIVGTAFGAMCVAILYNVLNLLGVDSLWQEFFIGLIILLIVSLDCIKTIWMKKHDAVRQLRKISEEVVV